jgi:hypothetical protein
LSFDMNLFKDRQSKNFYIWKKLYHFVCGVTIQNTQLVQLKMLN